MASERGGDSVRQAVWRWHFIAGLLCLPFMLWLALTGSVYLFETEIETGLHRPLLVVEAKGPPLPPSRLIAAAGGGDQAQSYVAPETAGRSAEVVVASPSGETRSVFVNPYTAERLGELSAGWRVTDLARRLHGLALLGPFANGLIEAVAGWILILSATGVYLWWPRPGRGHPLSVRGSSGARLFWRDLHSVIGLGVSIFLIFFALTGLMWSGVWGATVHEGLRRIGQGVPDAMWTAPPTSGGEDPSADLGDHQSHAAHLAHGGAQSWTAQGLPGRSDTTELRPSLSLAQAAEVVEAQGLRAHYTLSAPRSPDGVFMASSIPDKAAGLRVIQVDRYSGAVLNDFSYSDYGAASQVVEWGVSLHMGKEYGRWSQWLMLLACLAVFGLGVTATVSWLKRRLRGRFGAPTVRDVRDWKVVTAVILAVGLLFPLTGLMVLVIAGIDAVGQRRASS